MSNTTLPSIERIQHLLRTHRRSMRAHELADRLGVEDADWERFTQLLERATERGQLRQLPGGRYAWSGRKRRVVVEGVVSVHPRGFGFVRTSQLGEDVFIPAAWLGGAMNGDTVRVALGEPSSKGLEGTVQDIVQRSENRLQGVVHVRGRSAWFEVDDPRMPPIINLENATAEQDGKLAVVRITRYPAHPREAPVGRVEQVLGQPGDPKAEVQAILVREGLEESFPQEVQQQMKALPKQVGPELLKGRTDLRHIPFATIDPEDARDHDDAIWVRKTEHGFEAWVAIADVSAWVPEGSPADEEAYRRAFTVYLPDRAVPMLPHELSAHLGSLLPGVDRLCMAVHLTYDEKGRLTSSEVVEGVMRSRASLSYRGVAAALGWTEDEVPKELGVPLQLLRDLDELTRLLKDRRVERGSLELVVPEAHIVVDETTALPIRVEQRAADPGERQAYRLVEEMMLAANETVAGWLESRKIPAVYRVHASPDPKKLERLAALCDGLGIEFDAEELMSTEGVALFLSRIADHPLASVLGAFTLQSLAQASYSATNIGHFGLALDRYVHFTSPIRRYPDLTIHRQIKKVLRRERSSKPISEERIRQISMHCTQRERTTVSIEREVVELYQALFMQDWVGRTVTGVVTDIRARDIAVTVDKPFVRVLVPHNWLGSHRWITTDDGLRLVARGSGETIRLGSRIEIRIERIEIASRRILGKKIKTFSSKKKRERRRNPVVHRQRQRRNRSNIRRK